MNQGKNAGKRNRPHHHKHIKINVGDKGKQVLENINESSPVIRQFREYTLELDKKHDRYEKIVKISRDITIESKRIIFLLHTIDNDSKREKTLIEAKQRLDDLMKTLFKNIAIELDGQDAYQYLRAYRAGLQEFIEALTFYYYLESSNLIHWLDFQDKFKYSIKICPSNDKNESLCDEKNIQEEENIDENIPDEEKINKNLVSGEKKIETLFPPSEYILGIVDLTGELMRKCINDLSTGDINSCFKTCSIVRNMYTQFLGLSGTMGKEINRKVYTLKQSLSKMENVCYNIKVRGSEIPRHMLADVVCAPTEDFPDDNDTFEEF